MPESYTITAGSRTWTRDTLSAAKSLADTMVSEWGQERSGDVITEAIVTLTETGWVEYIAKAEVPSA